MWNSEVSIGLEPARDLQYLSIYLCECRPEKEVRRVPDCRLLPPPYCRLAGAQYHPAVHTIRSMHGMVVENDSQGRVGRVVTILGNLSDIDKLEIAGRIEPDQCFALH
jgi:hypothetical protein